MLLVGQFIDLLAHLFHQVLAAVRNHHLPGAFESLRTAAYLDDLSEDCQPCP
jgi:hypothetical protein